jgi:heat shock protein HslJ
MRRLVVVAMAGCGDDDHTTDGGTLAIKAPVATRMACATPAGVMERERAYQAAPPLAAGCRVEGSMLSLVAADGTYAATYARTS